MVTKEALGTTLALLTAIISGFSIFANKYFITGLDPTVFTALRAIMIGAVFLILSLAASKWTFKEFKKTNWARLIIIGIIGGGIAFWLFFTGLKITTAGRAGFIHKTLPLWVTLMAIIFLKEKVTKKQWIALTVMLVGLITLVTTTITPTELWQNPGVGDLLIIAATLLWGVENIIAKKAMNKGSTNWIVSFARMTFGAVILFGIAILTKKISLITTLTGTQWTYILASTIILFGYVLTYYWSIKHINVSKASTILLLSPVITLILGISFLGEPAPAQQLIGSALIILGAFLITKVKSEIVNV